MWHLIIPPIIIIVSIALLARYLSRKIADPALSEQVDMAMGSVESHAKARSLSRTEFFLKLSDRVISMFKVLALRTHNFFQQSSEHLREKRKKVSEMKRVAENVSLSAKDRFSSLSRPSFATWWKESQQDGESSGSPETEPAMAVRSREEKPFAKAAKGDVLPVEPAHPVRPHIEKWKEDGFIQRIAENPKDLVAYEGLGDYYFSIGSMQDAKSCYRQALKLQPTNRVIKIKIRKLEKFFEEKGN